MRRFCIFFPLLLVPMLCHALDGNNLEIEILKIMERYRAVGVSAAVIKDNRIIYTRSFGYNPNYKDTTLRMAIPINGKFVIQSISKSFIATAIMQLVEKGKLSLDDDANNYLSFSLRNPRYPSAPITIRMLLSHRSTINDKHYAWTLDQINPVMGKRWQECYNDYKPGTAFNYCNLNYSLLGAIIETVSKERFFDYIDENIIKPLGLNGSFNLTKIDSNLVVRALIYDKNTKRYRLDPTIYNYQFYRNKLKDYRLGDTTASFSPSGGMKMSIVDLAKYMKMHMNYGEFDGIRILSKRSELEMWKPQGPDKNGDTYFHKYGLAFSCFDYVVEGENFVGITGGAHGVHSAIYFNPEKKYGFAVICNGSTVGMKLINTVVQSLYQFLIK